MRLRVHELRHAQIQETVHGWVGDRVRRPRVGPRGDVQRTPNAAHVRQRLVEGVVVAAAKHPRLARRETNGPRVPAARFEECVESAQFGWRGEPRQRALPLIREFRCSERPQPLLAVRGQDCCPPRRRREPESVEDANKIIARATSGARVEKAGRRSVRRAALAACHAASMRGRAQGRHEERVKVSRGLASAPLIAFHCSSGHAEQGRTAPHVGASANERGCRRGASVL